MVTPLNTDSLYGYLAGILDGEGSIMIKRSCYRIGKDYKNPQYNPKISIKMSDDKPLVLFKTTFGGTLYKAKIYQSKTGFMTSKALFVYIAEHKIAEKVLTTLLPYLLVKTKQAKLALEVPMLKLQFTKRESDGIFHAQPYSKELITRLDENWLKVKQLNGGKYAEHSQ